MASKSLMSEFSSGIAQLKMDMVPRQLLLDCEENVGRLKRQLQDALTNQDSEVTVAAHTLQAQLRAVQKQQKTTEDQLNRSIARERDLRDQLVSSDVMTVMSQLRRENKDLRAQNESLSEAATKGQESEAMLILIRNKLEASQEELLRTRAGSSLEKQSTKEEVAALKKALDLAQIDMINCEHVLRREKEMQEAIKRSAEQLNEKDKQILDMQDEVDRAVSALSAANGDARAKGAKATDIERELRNEQKRAEEAIMLQNETEKANVKQLQTVSSLQQQLEHAQESFKKLSQRLQEAELELSSANKKLRLLEENSTRDAGSLSSQLREMQSKMENTRESSRQAEEENRATREDLRKELHKTESEGKHLREVLRKERDLLEKMMREHSAKESEYTEQRQRFEAQATRREMAMQTRLQSAEKELDALRMTSVPESKLRLLQEQFNMERDQLQQRLDMALQDVTRAEQQKTISLRSLEQSLANLSTEAEIASSKIRSLEWKLQEAEETSGCERKARLVAADQLRVFKGALEGRTFQPQSSDIKLTKVAQAAMELVGDTSRVFQSIQKQMADTSRERLDGQPRTALGIVVVENTVEMTVPGSPAEVCGMISAGDEILAVDGKAVQGHGIMSALRGDDLIGGVVSVMVRKQLSKEVLEVHLPRTDIVVVQQRQSIMEDLVQFSAQAVQAGDSHQPGVLGDRLDKILAGMKALEQLDITVQYKLCMQVMELRKGFNLGIQNAWQAVKQVDDAHQQAHALQDHTEQALREQLSKRDGQSALDTGQAHAHGMAHAAANTSNLHAQIQNLGRETSRLQNELSAKAMLLAEAKHDAQRLREALLHSEEKVIVFEEGQRSMRGTVMDLEEQLADAVSEMIQFPYAVAVGINVEWNATMRDGMTRTKLDAQLREDISGALRIPKNAVSTVCYHRDEGHVMAVIKFCSVMPSGGTVESGLRTAKALASQFLEQVEDVGSGLRDGPLGALLKESVLQGPISESTATAIRKSTLDMQTDDGWVQDELVRMGELVKRSEDRARAAVEVGQSETEKLILENLALEQAASLATKEGAEESAKRAQQGVMREQLVDMAELRRKHLVEEEDWERAMKTKEYEIAVLKEQMNANLVRDSGVKSDKEKGYEIARSVQDAYHKLQIAAAQMRELVEPEVQACITTLNNVESEMAFFHAYQMRALQIASSMG